MVVDTEDSDSDDEYSMIPLLIFPEESDNKEDEPRESPSDLHSMDPALELGPPSEKPTKEVASEPNSDALSEPSISTRRGYMGHLAPGYIMRYHKVSYPPRFFTLEECTKEDPWGDT